ncbi:hypothetical protein ACFSLT_00860 [Novosphingobium resinovorum]
MLLLSNAIAFVAATFLLIEWRSLRERFLLSFALGFLCIVVGCTLAPLRQSGDFLLGVWLSNSMVPLAHFMFLHGAASFAQRRLSRVWFLAPLACSALMAALASATVIRSCRCSMPGSWRCSASGLQACCWKRAAPPVRKPAPSSRRSWSMARSMP